MEVNSGTGRDNLLMDTSSDDDWARPLFRSTPNGPNSPQGYQMSAAETFVLTLHDSVSSFGATAKPGICQNASEVGTIEVVEDNLIAAETDSRCGPEYDARLWQCFLKAKKIPEVLSVICLNANEVRLQSYTNLVPVCIIRYTLTDRVHKILRNIVKTDCVALLNKCYIHVTLKGSNFDKELFGSKATSNMEDLELRLLQPTMSSTKMVDGALLTEQELEQPGIPALRRAVTDAVEAVEALRAQRELLHKNRQLKRQQEEDLRLSEMEDKRKKSMQTGEEPAEKPQDEPVENAPEVTVVDSEEVRERRLQRFGQEEDLDRNQRPEGIEEHQEDSGTVTFNL